MQMDPWFKCHLALLPHITYITWFIQPQILGDVTSYHWIVTYLSRAHAVFDVSANISHLSLLCNWLLTNSNEITDNLSEVSRSLVTHPDIEHHHWITWWSSISQLLNMFHHYFPAHWQTQRYEVPAVTCHVTVYIVTPNCTVQSQ